MLLRAEGGAGAVDLADGDADADAPPAPPAPPSLITPAHMGGSTRVARKSTAACSGPSAALRIVALMLGGCHGKAFGIVFRSACAASRKVS